MSGCVCSGSSVSSTGWSSSPCGEGPAGPGLERSAGDDLAHRRRGAHQRRVARWPDLLDDHGGLGRFSCSPAWSISPCSTRAQPPGFRLSNVIFSFIAGILLLILGAYGRFSGGLAVDNPYYQLRHRGEPSSRRRTSSTRKTERWMTAEGAVAAPPRNKTRGTRGRAAPRRPGAPARMGALRSSPSTRPRPRSNCQPSTPPSQCRRSNPRTARCTKGRVCAAHPASQITVGIAACRAGGHFRPGVERASFTSP